MNGFPVNIQNFIYRELETADLDVVLIIHLSQNWSKLGRNNLLAQAAFFSWKGFWKSIIYEVKFQHEHRNVFLFLSHNEIEIGQ